MVTESNYRLILATCVLAVIQFQLVISTLSTYFPMLTDFIDHESTEPRPKNLALFVSICVELPMGSFDNQADAFSSLGNRPKESTCCWYYR